MFLYRIAIKPDDTHYQRITEGIVSSTVTLTIYNFFIAPEPLLNEHWIVIIAASAVAGYFVGCLREQEMRHRTTVALQKAIKAFFQSIVWIALMLALVIVMVMFTNSETITRSKLLENSNYLNLVWSFLIISIIVAIATFIIEK